ncbi:hypothetical protein ACX0G7_09720 [Flavitalea antarctica]
MSNQSENKVEQMFIQMMDAMFGNKWPEHTHSDQFRMFFYGGMGAGVTMMAALSSEFSQPIMKEINEFVYASKSEYKDDPIVVATGSIIVDCALKAKQPS